MLKCPVLDAEQTRLTTAAPGYRAAGPDGGIGRAAVATDPSEAKHMGFTSMFTRGLSGKHVEHGETQQFSSEQK